jgi:hypothetical protein
MATAIRNHGRRIEIKMIAPKILDEVLSNVRKESAKQKSVQVTRPGHVSGVEPASTLSIVSTSLENRFMIRPSGYVKCLVGRELSRLEDAYGSLEKRHWAVHDAANSILPGCEVEERLRKGEPT